MKSIAWYLGMSVGLVLAGGACLGAGLLNRSMARAQQNVMALKYDEADRAFATAERYFEYESRLPWIGDGPVNDVRTRRAAIQYWRRQYATIISQQASLGSSAGADNIGLQLVAANAVYRAGETQAQDRQALLQAVDSGIQANLAILKNTARQDDAAYNYEYLFRLRQRILDEGGTFIHRPLTGWEGNGLSGGHLVERGDSTKFKTIIPETNEERKKQDGSAGKITPAQRKG